MVLAFAPSPYLLQHSFFLLWYAKVDSYVLANGSYRTYLFQVLIMGSNSVGQSMKLFH